MSKITFLPISNPIISTINGSPVTFEFSNLSNERVSIYWIDYDGNLRFYSDVAPGGVATQKGTLTSHAWEVTSADGKVGFKFDPTSLGKITVGADYQPSFTDYSEHVVQTSSGPWSTAQGYGLINVAKSLGIADTYALPLNGQNNNLSLDAISAPAAWAAGYTGKGVTVAVIDCGIAANAEINRAVIGGYDFVDQDSTPQPDEGIYNDHALNVAAIIAGSHDSHAGQDTMGVAPDASLLNVRVGGSAGDIRTSNIISAITWAVDHGAKVLNISLGNASTVVDDAVVSAIDHAFQHNVVTVISAGNSSSFGATGLALDAQLHGEAIVVGNYEVGAGSPFNSSNMPGASSPSPWVIASSSGYVPNSAGGYKYVSDGGTSLAAPYVSGLAALLFQQSPNASAAEIITKITAGASIGGNAASVGLPTVTHGTAGIDTHPFHGAAANYSIATFGGVTTVTDNKGTDGIILLADVERLAFSDENIALDLNGNGGEAYRLYQAAFNRAPDKAGLGFWMSVIDNGSSLAQVATAFANSAEFQQLYGTNPSGNSLVSAMYQNVLHRAPDAGGLAYWLDQLGHGGSTGQLLTAFSESPENQAAAIKLIGQGIEYQPHT